MPGVGTLIDMSGIIAGGATALAFGRLFSEQMKNMMMTVCGISVFVIGITGIMQGMLTVSGGEVSVNGSIPLLISLVAGTLIGEMLGIEKGINRLGMLLQKQVRQDDGEGFADGACPLRGISKGCWYLARGGRIHVRFSDAGSSVARKRNQQTGLSATGQMD